MAIFGAMIFFCFHGLNDMGKPRRDGGAFFFFAGCVAFVCISVPKDVHLHRMKLNFCIIYI